MARVTRRKFLKTSGTGAMAGILATGTAPAYAQTSSLHWLKWNDFVPAGDQILRQSMLAEAEKALGFKINMGLTARTSPRLAALSTSRACRSQNAMCASTSLTDQIPTAPGWFMSATLNCEMSSSSCVLVVRIRAVNSITCISST